MTDNALNALRQAKVLIAVSDDKIAARLQQMLRDHLIDNVHRTLCQVETIQEMSKNHYDIILCSYSLHHSIDGQAIFEEMHRLGLIDYNTIFLLLVSKNPEEIKIRSIEHEPDGYIHIDRPQFPEESLKKMLALLTFRHEFHELYQAITLRHYKEALEFCDTKINQPKPHHLVYLLRIKGKLLSISGRYDEALKFYQELLEKKQLAWIYYEIGRVQLVLNKLEDAERNIEKAKAMNPYCEETYQYLYKIKLEQQNYSAAQVQLLDGIQMNPHSITMHQLLYDISSRLGDKANAVKGLKASAALGRYSYLRRYTDFIHYSTYFFESSQDDDLKSFLIALKNACTIVEELPNMYPDDNNMKVTVYHHLAELLEAGSKHFHAMSQSLVNNDASDMKGIIRNDRPTDKKVPTEDLPHAHHFNEEIGAEYRVAHNEAINWYSKQKFDEAEKIFSSLVMQVPKNINVRLNATITSLKLANIQNDKFYLDQAENYLSKVKVAQDSKHYPRYQEITELMEITRKKFQNKT